MKKNNIKRLEIDLENNLMLLVESNNKYGVETYIKNVPAGTNDEKKSLAFLYSCKIGRIEIAKILLDCINPNTRYADGQTSLMLIAQNDVDIKDKSEFMELLIERGCEVDLVDFCGKSALHWAVIKNCSWSTRILINRCNVNSVDLLGMTPLMYAAKFNFCSMVSLLLHAGADPTKSTKQQGSAIHITIRHRASGALQQMIPFCRHWNILDSRNQSPLDLAVLLDNVEFVRILIESKKELEVNRRPSFAPFRTPLEEACFKNNLEMTDIVLSAGADVNHSLEFAFEVEQQNCRSKPIAPLMFAILKQNVKMVELLISKGADVDVRCPKAPGHALLTSPLALAAEMGNLQIIDILERSKSEFNQFITCESFSAACSSHNVDIGIRFLEKYKISPSQYRLKNGLPVILDLIKCCSNMGNMEKISNLNQDFIGNLFTAEIAHLLSNKSFGSTMQVYRESWLEAAAQCQNGKLEISNSTEESFLKFIISFLEFFFLKKKIDDLKSVHQKLQLLRIFPERMIRNAMHSSNLIKSILLSRSIYALIFLTELHLDEKLIFWDMKSEQILDLCEFALFFDNIEAALVLNLACGISLNCIIEYETFPYVPEIINPSIEYNDVDKIAALKHLSKNIKPLKVLCKYAIRKLVSSDVMLSKLPGLSQSVLDDLLLDLSEYICYFESSENSIVKYSQLCQWAGVDSHLSNFSDF